jgi:hypothetical protein
VPEPGMDALDISDSVRLSVFAMFVCTGWARDGRIGVGFGEGIELQEPSR